jgi:hypothetical protein
MTALPQYLSDILALAAEFEQFGARDQAAAVRATIDLVCQRLSDWWNESMSYEAAAIHGGYSTSQLRRLVAAGTIHTAPDGGIRRVDVPVRPGHRPPMGLEPAEVGESDWTAKLVQRRQMGRLK